jgi:8-oxo-dGTP pyrophosphatase MutT (NUDIX family)
MLCSESKIKKISELYKFEIKAKYTGRKKSLFNYIDTLEKSNKPKNILLYSIDFEGLKRDFLSLYTIVEASGGLVLNEENEILFIYRRKKWDLPKGKIDIGESKKAAAIREVKEETGIKKLSLIVKICTTNHTYSCKANKRCIKKSYWYFMKSPKQKLIPQVEEDIEIAKWMTPEAFHKLKPDVYTSIKEVLRKARKKGLIK